MTKSNAQNAQAPMTTSQEPMTTQLTVTEPLTIDSILLLIGRNLSGLSLLQSAAAQLEEDLASEVRDAIITLHNEVPRDGYWALSDSPRANLAMVMAAGVPQFYNIGRDGLGEAVGAPKDGAITMAFMAPLIFAAQLEEEARPVILVRGANGAMYSITRAQLTTAYVAVTSVPRTSTVSGLPDDIQVRMVHAQRLVVLAQRAGIL